MKTNKQHMHMAFVSVKVVPSVNFIIIPSHQIGVCGCGLAPIN